MGIVPFSWIALKALMAPLRLSPSTIPQLLMGPEPVGASTSIPEDTGAEWYAAPRGYIRMGIAPRPTGTEDPSQPS